MLFKEIRRLFLTLKQGTGKIRIVEAKESLKIIKSSDHLQKKYFEIRKRVCFLLGLCILISYIFLKIYASFSFFRVLVSYYLIFFFLFMVDRFLILEYCDEILIFTDSIILQYQIEDKILYEKIMNFYDMKEINIKLAKKTYKQQIRNSIPSITHRGLEENRILKIIGKEETFSWGYRISEKEAIEVKKRIEKNYQI